ncbi:MAG: ThiF family adenylyltransferase [Acidobacteriaceae bacterium]|nr:ThiF family adenylyltransferase [Acidobacteriaceae bacterium]
MRTGERHRYSRQILFQPIGEAGQLKIRSASVCITGCGALGSFQAEALARAGIGKLVLIDRDYVDFSNLQRQCLYDESDARNEAPKAIAAARRLSQLNRDVEVQPHVSDLTPSNAEELISRCDLILDGTDNFETRYLLNDISVKLGIPWIYGAAIGSYGVTVPIVPPKGPCFACIYPEPPKSAQPTCDVDGVLSSITGVVASMQVAMALRLIVRSSSDFSCSIQTFDVWQGTSKQVPAGPPDPECATCGKRKFHYLEGQRRSPVSLCGRNAVQLHDSDRPLDLELLARKLQPLGTVRVNEFALRMTLPKYDVTFFRDGRAIVKGTTDIAIARGVYARLVGS